MAKLDDKFTEEVIRLGNEIISNAESSGKIQSGLESLIALLKEHKLVWSGRMDPHAVGVHPENRSRLGVVGADAQLLGKQILQVGFS